MFIIFWLYCNDVTKYKYKKYLIGGDKDEKTYFYVTGFSNGIRFSCM